MQFVSQLTELLFTTYRCWHNPQRVHRYIPKKRVVVMFDDLKHIQQSDGFHDTLSSFILGVVRDLFVHYSLLIVDDFRENLQEFGETPRHKVLIDCSMFDKFIGKQKNANNKKQRTFPPDVLQ